MIKIRYTDLPAGLHVRAETSGRHTVIYLLPGLSHGERRAALLRARRSAGLGRGPELPATGVAAAVARDRIAATARNGLTAFRGHPLLLLPPVLVVASATLVYVMLSAVSVTFPPGSRDARVPPGRPGVSGSTGAGAAAAGRPALPAGGSTRRGSAGPRPERSPRPAPDPGTGPPGSADGTPGDGTPATPTGDPTSAPPSPVSSASAAPTSGPASLAPSPPPGSTCVSLSLLGICVK